MPAEDLSAAALRVRQRYDAANAEQDAAGWYGRSPEHVAAIRLMQDAYVAYVAAFGRAYPAEAHLLPCQYRGPQMPEYAAYRAAAAALDRVEARRAARPDGSFDVIAGMAGQGGAS